MSDAPQTAAEFFRYVHNIKLALDKAIADYQAAIERGASTKRAAKLARASATLATSGQKITVAEREAHVVQAIADVEYEADLSEDMKKLARDRVEAIRQQMSAAQSYASLSKAEAMLAKYEPSEVSA